MLRAAEAKGDIVLADLIRLGMGERDALLWAAQIQRGEAKQDPELFKLRYDGLKTQMD
ncbi:hypothetical protein MCP1_10146 [Candidatus Terasakiella magnetica]|nr:hypothetical protein MCP1_10146 [Candidatus Terasakiella magnetica]